MDEFVAYGEHRPWLTLLFVNDGSTDGTADLIASAEKQCPDRIRSVTLDRNSGKGEAVRRGVLCALESGADLVAFWDADLATPLLDIDTFREHFETRPDLEVALGSRVRLLGRRIERKPVRHYFGRIAATAASSLLGIAVYDTQCGAKMFRRTSRTHRIFSDPFITRWVFDVEILARYLSEARITYDIDRRMTEIPVSRWTNADGSRLRLTDFVRAPVELLRIYARYRGLLTRARPDSD